MRLNRILLLSHNQQDVLPGDNGFDANRVAPMDDFLLDIHPRIWVANHHTFDAADSRGDTLELDHCPHTGSDENRKRKFQNENESY